MSPILASLIITGLAVIGGTIGGWVATWNLRKSILEEIRAAAAGDKAE